MDAVILAAGLGTRLRPHTLTTPKPLLPVRGRPILDWTLSVLPPAVDRVIVVTHYLAEQVEAYLKDQSHFRDWQTVHQEQPRGTGDAFRACRDVIRSERFLVLNGDDLYGAADLARLAEKPAGLLAHPVNEPEKFGIVFRRPDGVLKQLREKPTGLPAPQLANIGAYLFPKWSLQVTLPLSPRGEYEITDAVTANASVTPFYVVEATVWLPIGDIAAWERAGQMELEALLGAR